MNVPPTSSVDDNRRLGNATRRPRHQTADGFLTDFEPRRISADVEHVVEEDRISDVAGALGRAVSRVRAMWSADAEVGAPEMRAQLDWLCEALRQACAGDEPKLSELSTPVHAKRALDSVRGAFLDEVTRGGTPTVGELMGVLTAMERVSSALDRDSAQRFANKLTGPDGLDMVVEVAHDLRSPLASILFLAETLRNGQSGSINPIQERQLGLVYSAAFGLSALASDVIELVRGGERLMDLHPAPFSVSETLQSVRDIVLPIAEEKGLAVKITPPDTDLRIGHAAALNRVLLNLTTNALKFTSEGYVEVSCRPVTKTRLEFSVRDTGRGIPVEVLPTLFDAFRRRMKPGQYTFSSAGLGLSICRKLVTRMGGEMEVETAPGYGTRFHFELDLPFSTRL